jgi:hypothetical protein
MPNIKAIRQKIQKNFFYQVNQIQTSERCPPTVVTFLKYSAKHCLSKNKKFLAMNHLTNLV